MTLYLIGLGLSDEKDITLRGLEAVKKCSKVYLENYTSLLQCSLADLEKAFGKKIILADRLQTENKSDDIINGSAKNDVALLIVGDPLAATTHVNYILDCKKKNIPITIIHNASILTAVGEVGLELYKYGKVTSVPFAESNTSHEVIESNRKNNLHTLVLLDLDPDRKRFVTISEAVQRLKLTENIVGCARLGADSKIVFGSPAVLQRVDFGNPPFCLVVPAPKLHFVEEEALEMWKGT